MKGGMTRKAKIGLLTSALSAFIATGLFIAPVQEQLKLTNPLAASASSSIVSGEVETEQTDTKAEEVENKAEETEHKTFIKGDLTLDRQIDCFDMVMMRKMISEPEKIENYTFLQSISDLNDDNIVDIEDAKLLQQYILGGIDRFPVESNVYDPDIVVTTPVETTTTTTTTTPTTTSTTVTASTVTTTTTEDITTVSDTTTPTTSTDTSTSSETTTSTTTSTTTTTSEKPSTDTTTETTNESSQTPKTNSETTKTSETTTTTSETTSSSKQSTTSSDSTTETYTTTTAKPPSSVPKDTSKPSETSTTATSAQTTTTSTTASTSSNTGNTTTEPVSNGIKVSEKDLNDRNKNEKAFSEALFIALNKQRELAGEQPAKYPTSKDGVAYNLETYAWYRAVQLATRFEHNYDDMETAEIRAFDKDEKIRLKYYYGEAIVSLGISEEDYDKESLTVLSNRIANLLRNSPGHWAVIGDEYTSYLSVGVYIEGNQCTICVAGLFSDSPILK